MLLADDSQIISLSEISTDILSSAMAEEASKYHQNNSGAEEVYLLQPDIVFAGIYTAKATVNMLESLGIRVEKFEPANTIEQIILNMQRTGKLLGHTDRANTLVANFEARLTDLTTGINTRPRAALYYANGYTTGGKHSRRANFRSGRFFKHSFRGWYTLGWDAAIRVINYVET